MKNSYNKRIKYLEFIKKFIPSKRKREQIKQQIIFLEKTGSVSELNCTVGKCTYCGKNVQVFDTGTKIGSFCSLADNINIGLSSHPLNYLTTSPFMYVDLLGYNDKCREIYTKPVEIGNDVWIGSNVSIMMGVKIGDGAVIGAHALVNKDVPPYAVVAGVPAKILKYRFDEKTIKELLELKWWDLDDEIIKKLPFKSVSETIDFIKNEEIKSKMFIAKKD